MGFIEEIERRRQQQIQAELARKAEAERQQRLAAEEQLRRLREHEIKAKGFVADCKILIPILERLSQLGYKDYLIGVSEISGFQLAWTLYTLYPNPAFGPDGKLTTPQIRAGVGSELSKQQIELQERRKQLIDELFPQRWFRQREHRHITSKAFFGDDLVTSTQSREKRSVVEPQEVGVGIRLLKHVEECGGPNPVLKAFHTAHEYLVENWEHAVYVRVSAPGEAVITGFEQRWVSLGDIRSFDKTLEEVMHRPAVKYMSTKRKWEWIHFYRHTTSGGDYLRG